jgi:hypothetical protein
METRKKITQYRQGDVLIESAVEKPSGEKQPIGMVVLAVGEATLHDHSVDEGEAWKVGPDVLFFKTTRQTSVKHQEHAPIPLAKGTYKITRQREYSPEAIRRVAD